MSIAALKPAVRLTKTILSDIVPAKLGMRGQPAFSDWRFRLSNAGGHWAAGAISSSQWLASQRKFLSLSSLENSSSKGRDRNVQNVQGVADIKALYRSSGTRYSADEEPVKKKS
jgi:hypothetical protein